MKSSGCKVLEKCKTCQCCKKQKAGLADKLKPYRPTERVVERQITELARSCEACNKKEANNAD